MPVLPNPVLLSPVLASFVLPDPVLSVCLRCRDGREAVSGDVRGGTRLAHAVARAAAVRDPSVTLRGVNCMSQCPRACVASLTAPGAFTYVFGDLDPAQPEHVAALLDVLPRFAAAPEGFLTRDARPEPLRARILGRLPPIGTTSDLVVSLVPHPDPEVPA